MSSLRKLLATTPFPRAVAPSRSHKSSPEPSSPTPPATDRPSQTAFHFQLVDPTPQPSPHLPVISEVRSASQPRVDAKVACPVERLRLQPVGTSDHYLGRCFCYLCKCGLHICPGDLRKSAESPTTKRPLKSKYQEEYTKREHKPVRSLTLNSQSSLPAPKGMDLKTTKQMDFTNPGVAVVPKRPFRSVPKGVKLVTRSSYQRDFPDWKPGETVLFKCIELPYRGDIVSFKTKSTYQDEFIAEKPSENFNSMRSRKRSDPIAVLNDFYGSTSHKSEYQLPSKTYALDDGKALKQNARNQSEWFATPQVRSLTTTYRSEFSPKDHPLHVPFKHKAKSAVVIDPAEGKD